MFINKSIVSTVALSFMFGMSLPAVAYSNVTEPTISLKQDSKKSRKKTKRVEALSMATGKTITKVVEMYDVKDYPRALDILLNLKKKHDRGKLKGIDSATMWQFFGSIYYELDQLEKSVAAFEEFLKFKDSVNESTYYQTLYNVGQLKFSAAMDLPEGAARTRAMTDVKKIFVRWEREVLSPISTNQYYYLSQLSLVTEDFKGTLRYTDKVLALAETTLIEPKEKWYKTRLQAFSALEQYPQVVDTLLTLINTWPKPRYWRHLAAAFSQNDNDDSFFAVTEINYESGFFERGGEYTNMAQIYLVKDVPIKATWVLERAMKDEILESNDKTLMILGQAYLRAGEYEKAIEPLSELARLTDNWKMWMQVGQVHQSMANFSGAETAFAEALRVMPDTIKGERFGLLTLQGNAYTELRKFSDAKESFDAAKKLAKSSRERKQMTNWFKYLKNEETRWEMLQ